MFFTHGARPNRVIVSFYDPSQALDFAKGLPPTPRKLGLMLRALDRCVMEEPPVVTTQLSLRGLSRVGERLEDCAARAPETLEAGRLLDMGHAILNFAPSPTS